MKATPQLKRLIIIGLLLISSIALVGIWWSTVSNAPVVRAQEKVESMEKRLAKVGAVKKCAGNTKDLSIMPAPEGYVVYYETTLNREEALSTIRSLNEFELKEATLHSLKAVAKDKEVAEDNLKDWFVDERKKVSIGLSNDGGYSISQVACGTQYPVSITSTDQKTAVEIRVLP